jgi:two-component system, sensor histidine kinase and response regulator
MEAARPAVLVVDDEPMNRSLIRATLSPTCEVVEAANGPEALELLKTRSVDLVLLDVMMPGMDGFEVCRRIKEVQLNYLPVVLVTALGEQSDKNRGLESGADDFLTKPVDRRELLLRTRAFLRLREQDKIIHRQLEEMKALQTQKDDLVALLVHDLRSPLAGVVAHLQLLEEDLSGRAKADVQQALKAADVALRRLEETLQVRLMEEGELTIRRLPVSLGMIVQDTLAEASGIARRKNITLRAELGDAPTADVDEALVRRSIENLLSNALKYTPSGAEVSVSVRAADKGVILEVSDRGPGVPDSLKTGMFEKFGSIEVKKGGARKGFGLGLYLVKLVAQGHGGSVTIEDREGGGSTFRLFLGTP